MKRISIILSLLPFLLTSCEENVPDLSSNIPKVIISEWSCDGSQTFVFKASVLSQDVGPVEKCGFYCSDNGAMQGAENYPSRLTGSTFSAEITLAEMSRPYHVCAYISNGRSEICSESVVVEATGEVVYEDNYINLSSLGSANCYIVSQSGIYKFKSVKGNGSEPVGQVASAEVLWETFGTSEAPSKGDLIRNVSYHDGVVNFSTAAIFREGNAVIAAKDADGNILWSWHIWLTDAPQGQTYNNNAGVMMDRNLGATSATPGDVEALGLLYQWGRKDPFLGSSSIVGNSAVESTIVWPSPVISTASTGSIAFATACPTTFIARNQINRDWCYSETISSDTERWKSSKTIYDPCPAGWKVPSGGNSGVWTIASQNLEKYVNKYDKNARGMNFSSVFGPNQVIWYPAVTYISSVTGMLGPTNNDGGCWSCSCDNLYAYDLYFTEDGLVDNVSTFSKALGAPVRCAKE